MCAGSAIGARCSSDGMSERIVLVTAFEPFGGEAVNASWEAASRIDGWRCAGAVVAARMLPCAYEACVSQFVEAFQLLRPCAVLMTGQAARRGLVCVERFARNRVSATARDNRGALGPAAAAGPDVLEATTPVHAVARAIREASVAARGSTDAGDYVCNHLYYGALRYLVGASPATPAIFIHLPATPMQSPLGASALRLAPADAVRALQATVQILSTRVPTRATVADQRLRPS